MAFVKGQKACRQCRSIYEGSKCPQCGAEGYVESFKGRVVIIDEEQSEIAKNLAINKKGVYALKLG